MVRYRRTKHGASLGRSRGQGIFDFFKPVMSLVNKAMEYKDCLLYTSPSPRD